MKKIVVLRDNIYKHLAAYAKNSLETLYHEALTLRNKKNAPLNNDDMHSLITRHEKRLRDYANKYKSANPTLFNSADCDDIMLNTMIKRILVSVTIDNTENRLNKLFE